MNSTIDLNLLPLARVGTELFSDLPDLYAVTPPRRTARGREADSLVIYLSMTGNSPLSNEAQAQLLEQLAHKFYKTSGSLTAALRTIVEALNLHLLDRNLRSTSMGHQGIGQLLLVALKGDTLYIAQCGTVHAFVITPKETQHLYDPQSSGRGLGLSRNAPIRFLQAKLDVGDFLVLSTNASPNWSDTSLKAPQGVEDLRSLLLGTAPQDFNAVIIQAQAGTGKLRILHRKAEAPEEPYPIEPSPAAAPADVITQTTPQRTIERALEKQEQKPAPIESLAGEVDALAFEEKAGREGAQVLEEKTAEGVQDSSNEVVINREAEQETPASLSPGTPPGINLEAASEALPQAEATPPPVAPVALRETPASAQTEEAYSSPTVQLPAEVMVQPTSSTLEAEHQRSKPTSQPPAWEKPLASIRATLAPATTTAWRALRSALATIGTATLRLLKNLLPDEDVLRVSPSVMVFLAVTIPIILAVVGGLIFLQRGRAQQYQIYYQQATEQAAKAASLTDPTEQRLALQAVITDLDKAEYYTVTSQSEELRAQVTAQLDSLDAVKRLDYQPAIVGGLDSEVNVTHMVATTHDLYMLNGKQGNVLHAIMTSRGYEVDPNFQCGPTYGPINVGPLVDIAELPPGAFEDASVLGMDANGNLLYCVVGDQPYSAAMAPPNTGFGEPSAMVLDQGDLYVLDPKVNAVWIYRNIEVSQQPHLFFGETVPPMQDVIDLAVYNADLFLLHADGHITKCSYSSIPASPTRCDDPYPYTDNRPGRTHGPVISDAVFNQIYFSSFPERTIYMLDPHNRSIYYFSVLLNLQWQYKSKESLAAGEATSFAISPNRMAFLAVGNMVYYAAAP